MKKLNTKSKLVALPLSLIAALTLTFSIASGQKPEENQTPNSSAAIERTIQGVWQTLVTPRNCQTGQPVAPAFHGLFTFNKGGTLSELCVVAYSTQRSSGHGYYPQLHSS